ncbi:MAG: Gfo/Idh/MocA family oxidoreductase [Opitutales bacterium]|nr:Gfo/Idh/MocA family oxidoreductase [Opitutales bacterium]MBT5170563.1 Gfo/Idh/MocA family oxidoreductase [Opitutales bacterium]MBT5813308.1 Gfo/Idh/MocA family oxidoreductase [Opitutales bacterium]MBT6767887.1 Gfo/Idh/MocA family oxidoreductase [Opitutales bacterium]MBT7865658.1 Gfo/Idh/MocA family oxidoreductase [Opitutales bacterium]
MSSRRTFLKRSALFASFSILPSHFVFGQKSSGGQLPPSQRVNLAAIGIGNQGRGDLSNLYASGHCNVVALCDVDLKGKHTQESQANHPNARRFTDFRVMFDQMADEIDAVLIAIPDHAHFCVAMLAMSLGKHVYVEKPLAHTFGQCERLIDLAERSGVVTQMGNQGHSGANYFQFKSWTEAGVIKDVNRISAFMNKDRRWHGWGASVEKYPNQPLPEGMDWDTWHCSGPVHPFSDKLHPQEWRSWYDYGSGAFGDWGPHILDTAHRFLELGLPRRITALKRDGANDLVFPQASTIQFQFAKRKAMPACTVTWYDGKENLPKVEDDLGELNISKPGKIIYGKDLTFAGGSHSDALRVVPQKKFMEVRETLPRIAGKNSNHYANYLLACKGEEESRSPFHVSGELTQVFNLGVIAQRLGGTIKFNPKTRRITNNKTGNALLDPAPRKGWEEYYKM